MSMLDRAFVARLADALAVELKRVAHSRAIPDSERQSYHEAAARAFTTLVGGWQWRRQGDIFWFLSESAARLVGAGCEVADDLLWNQCPAPNPRYPEYACSCRAASNGRVCWHRPGRRLLLAALRIHEPVPFEERPPALVEE